MTAPIPERHPDRSTRTEEAMSGYGPPRGWRGSNAWGTASPQRTEEPMSETETASASTPAPSGPVTTGYDATQWPEPIPLRNVPTELIVCGTRHVEDWFRGGAVEYEDDDVIGVILAAVLPLHEQRLCAERDAATARAERAEVALAEMRERLGKTDEQWDIRTRDDDPDEDIEVVSNEAIAREFASTWRSEIPDANPTAMVRTRCEPGPWREADTTPRTALERAADKQGVREGGAS